MGTPPELDSEGRGLFRAYCMLKQYGLFPKEGGLLNQSAKFLKTIEFCDAVNIAYARRKAEQDEQAAKGQDLLARMMGESGN